MTTTLAFFYLERIVQDALDKIRELRNLTTVTVAHRLSTIVHSDKIVVIADGAIQESGTHKELIEERGIYAGLCEGQGLGADAADRSDDAAFAYAPTGVPDPACPEVPADGSGDVEEAGDTCECAEEEINEEDSGPNLKGISSRLHEYSKADIGYSIMGFAGGIVVGCLPAAEAILFGVITGNFFIIDDAEVMRDTNFPLCLWFLLLAFCSLVGNIAMGVGFGVTGSRLTRRMRVLVFGKFMRYPMGWFDYADHSSGELTTILEEDSEEVSNVTGLQQGQRVQTFVCLAAGMVVALAYSWQIGLLGEFSYAFLSVAKFNDLTSFLSVSNCMHTVDSWCQHNSCSMRIT